MVILYSCMAASARRYVNTYMTLKYMRKNWRTRENQQNNDTRWYKNLSRTILGVL